MADAASAGDEAETFRRATTLASPTPPGKTPAAASAKSRPAVEAHLYDPLCGEFCQRVVGCTAAQAGLATSETQALLHAVDASWQDCASRCTQDLAIEPRKRYQSCIETAACEEFLECAQER